MGTSIFWIVGLGIAPFLFGVRTLTQGVKKEKFYIAVLLCVSSVLNFVVGVIGLTNPEILGALVLTGLIGSEVILLIIPVLVLSNGENAEGRSNRTVTIVAGLVLLGITGWAINQARLNALPPAPFVYEDMWLEETEYCVGDRLLLRFDGVSDSSGRGFIISGHITRLDDPVLNEPRRVFTYPNDTVPGNANANGIPQRFTNRFYDERIIPDLPPGPHTYTHSNEASTASLTSQRTTEPFNILPDSHERCQ